MATNNLAPIGFSFTRNYISGANTYAQTAATILNGYTSAIGMGDPVILNANGTVNIASAATGYTSTSYVLGFFAGVLPVLRHHVAGYFPRSEWFVRHDGCSRGWDQYSMLGGHRPVCHLPRPNPV